MAQAIGCVSRGRWCRVVFGNFLSIEEVEPLFVKR